MASRKFWFAVTMVPSSLNSITACDLLMAAACASALLMAVFRCELNITPHQPRETGDCDLPNLPYRLRSLV